MARAFFPGHNYQINLSEGQDGTEHYHQMFAFMRQSRICHVLTHAPVIYEPYLIDFWSNARHVKRAGGEVITSRIANRDIEFTAEDLRRILNLGTVEQEGGADGLTVYDRSVISGGLRRMGFAGDLSKSTLFKKGFFGRWRYLAHVLLVGLSNKKTGWDTLNQETQAQMVGMVYNKPYSFSKFFLNEIRKQISARGTTRFLMYPRFVMMILNDRLPGLPAVQPVVKVTTVTPRFPWVPGARRRNQTQHWQTYNRLHNVHLWPTRQVSTKLRQVYKPATQLHVCLQYITKSHA